MDERLNVQYLIVESPLYEKIPLGADAIPFLRGFETKRAAIDCFCVDCKKESVFHLIWTDDQEKIRDSYYAQGLTWAFMKKGNDYFDAVFPEKRVFTTVCYCMKNPLHTIHSTFMIHERSLCKIGQYPSLADLKDYEIRKYRGVLDDYSELSRAIGLASVNVGIGSFVYLRRIVERLIEEAHQEAKAEAHWDEEAYARSRVDEKIKLLKERLPALFLENTEMYSILSKGIPRPLRTRMPQILRMPCVLGSS